MESQIYRWPHLRIFFATTFFFVPYAMIFFFILGFNIDYVCVYFKISSGFVSTYLVPFQQPSKMSSLDPLPSLYIHIYHNTLPIIQRLQNRKCV